MYQEVNKFGFFGKPEPSGTLRSKKNWKKEESKFLKNEDENFQLLM